jgi:heptosyltransferase III
VVFVPQNPDILEVAAILERMQMLISPDTAMVHLASALKVPVVGLYYNIEKEVLWRPFGVPYRTIVAPSGKIEDIVVEDVLRQTNSLLKETI